MHFPKLEGQACAFGSFLAAVLKARNEPEKISFATLDFFSVQLWLKSPLDFCPLFLKKGDKRFIEFIEPDGTPK
jgi:hypothetical protein